MKNKKILVVSRALLFGAAFILASCGGGNTSSSSQSSSSAPASSSSTTSSNSSSSSSLPSSSPSSIVPETFTITWNVDGTITSEKYDKDATPTFKGSTAKAATAQYSYTFTGWLPAIAKVTANQTYVAQYSEDVNKYDITFVVDDVPTVKKVAYGEVPVFDGTPAKASSEQYDYTFKSWDKELVAVTGPATYTAVFEESLREYTITFIVNGATSTVQVPYGTIPTFDGSLDVDGKLFQSWDKDIVAVTGPATYTAVFVDDVPAQKGVASYNLSEASDLVITLNTTNATLSSLTYGGKTLNSNYYTFDADADTITIKNDLVKSLFLTANEESTIKASFTLGENTLDADLKVKATKNEAAVGDNVALNSSIRITDLAMSADWTLDCNAFNRGKVGSPAFMTDGANNMWEALGTNEIGADKTAGGLGYFIFDLGQEYFLSTIKYVGYHDWWMGGNYVKVASKADYSDAVSMQFTPGGLQADSLTNQIISLDVNYRCRYILVTNDKENAGSLSAMTGLQAYVGDESSYSNIGRNVAPLADVKVKSMDERRCRCFFTKFCLDRSFYRFRSYYQW